MILFVFWLASSKSCLGMIIDINRFDFRSRWSLRLFRCFHLLKTLFVFIFSSLCLFSFKLYSISIFHALSLFSWAFSILIPAKLLSFQRCMFEYFYYGWRAIISLRFMLLNLTMFFIVITVIILIIVFEIFFFIFIFIFRLASSAKTADKTDQLAWSTCYDRNDDQYWNHDVYQDQVS